MRRNTNTPAQSVILLHTLVNQVMRKIGLVSIAIFFLASAACADCVIGSVRFGRVRVARGSLKVENGVYVCRNSKNGLYFAYRFGRNYVTSTGEMVVKGTKIKYVTGLKFSGSKGAVVIKREMPGYRRVETWSVDVTAKKTKSGITMLVVTSKSQGAPLKLVLFRLSDGVASLSTMGRRRGLRYMCLRTQNSCPDFLRNLKPGTSFDSVASTLSSLLSNSSGTFSRTK